MPGRLGARVAIPENAHNILIEWGYAQLLEVGAGRPLSDSATAS